MIPIITPDVSFVEAEDDLRRILDSGILTGGKYVADFEQAIADRVGVPDVIATTSATTALHLVLFALGIAPGDEVLVSDFTFPASGNVIVELGATPVLVDSGTTYFGIDLEDLRSKITKRTGAIMVVHPFGQPADIVAISKLAQEAGIPVVEDAACALGSVRDGVACGALNPGCFSFHPRKVVTTGEGGAISIRDSQMADRMRQLRSHGGRRSEVGLTFVENGFNYRLGEMAAALGLVQLRRLDQILADRRRTAVMYNERLPAVGGVEVRKEGSGETWSYQSYVIMLDQSIDRDAIIANMRSRQVETTLGTYAMHAHPAFERFGYAPGDLPNSHLAQNQSLTLPLVPRMSEGDVDAVVIALSAAIDQCERHR